MFQRLLSSAAVLMVVASAAGAHEFWIQPGNFRPNVGENVGIHLMVGDGFPGEARPRDPTKLESFVTVGIKGCVPLPGIDGEDPAAIHRSEREGVQMLAYRSKNSSVQLTAEKFEKYIREEGLDNAVAIRQSKTQTDRPVKELFSRCCKTLICVAATSTQDLGYARVLGQPLEIVPLDNPYAKKAGDTIRVRVLLHGEPAANTQVNFFRDSAPAEHKHVRTDAEGVAAVPLEGTGSWIIGADEIHEAPAGADGDWESVWASLTFDVRDEAAPMTMQPMLAPAAAGPAKK